MIDPITELNKRLARGITQKDLAGQIGITPQFLHDILNRRRRPAKAVLAYLGLEQRVSYVRKVNGT
jgi:transcriptional regulator with XRE-family HTH domain